MKKACIVIAALFFLPAMACAQGAQARAGLKTSLETQHEPGAEESWRPLNRAAFGPEVEKWPLPLQTAYLVKAEGAKGQPVRNCPVKLLGAGGKTLWQSQTGASGLAVMWCEPEVRPKTIQLCHEERTYTLSIIQTAEKGINTFSIPTTCQPPAGIDLLALVDATHSMRDEFDGILDALRNAWAAGESRPGFRMQAILFRDYGERFLTQPISLEEISQHRDFRWQAAGGGEEPEAIDTALLSAIRGFDWRPHADARLLLFFTDAPPKADTGAAERLVNAMKLASAAGITIIPVGCSGLPPEGEFLLRSLALATGGPYASLSGQSAAPLGEWLNTLAAEYLSTIQCPEDGPTPLPSATARFNPALLSLVSCFPNPAAGKAYLLLGDDFDRLVARNLQGQAVMEMEKPDRGRHELNLENWTPGLYLLELHRGDEVAVERLLVERR